MEDSSMYDLNRELVENSYNVAKVTNSINFKNGDVKATEQYIFDNQKKDAINITELLKKFRVISIIKRTKCGMDGLMIEIAKNVSTQEDNKQIILAEDIFFITGMSNISWEIDMKKKIPSCFKDNVYHHGKLNKQVKTKLSNTRKALIIIDEIDVGDKIKQRLFNILNFCKLMDINDIISKNIKFIFVSATMEKEVFDLVNWGEYHTAYIMTVPSNYIGHGDFLERKIIQEYYEVKDEKSVNKWIQEDILNEYKQDYRVHIIRTEEKNSDIIRRSCLIKNITFIKHNSDNRISENTLKEIFESTINNHIILAIKGFFRRANLIPNLWKKKIGAIMEYCSVTSDINTQIQGLPGRMTGYWKDIIDGGHKTGPYRTSVEAIKNYEKWIKDPLVKVNKFNNNKLLLTHISLHNITIEKNDEKEHKIIDYKKNYRIPIYIPNLSREEKIFDKKCLNNSKIQCIKNILKQNSKYSSILKYIENKDVKCVQITTPDSDNSIKKHIKSLKQKISNKEPCSIDINGKNKEINNWQCFVDKENYGIIILPYCVDSGLYND